MPLKVLVIGAGIGGPAAAVALAKKGHEVTIVERSKLEKEVGFAFRITANSDRCLKYIGIDAVEGGAVAANTGKMMDGTNGETKRELDENTPSETDTGVSAFVFRPQLSAQLFQRCKEEGVQIQLGVKVREINTEKTSIVLEDGTTMTADLIIGADGVHSSVRPFLVDTSVYQPQPTLGRNCFRFMVSRAALEKDELTSTLELEKFHFLSWQLGPLFMILYPVDFGKQYNVVCTHPAQLSDSIIDSNSNSEKAATYDQSIPQADVLNMYGKFEPRARRILELADPHGFRVWKLADMEELPTWSKSSVVLIGDAAHPVLPFGFSGASMAIEDGISLAELLPETATAKDVPERLRLLEQIRRSRVGRVRDTARVIGSGKVDGEVVEPYMKFLSEHDAVGFARQALAQATGTA